MKKVWCPLSRKASTCPNGLRHPFLIVSAALSLLPSVQASAGSSLFLHPSAHTLAEGVGVLPSVGPRTWPTSAMRWGRGSCTRQVGETGLESRGRALRPSPLSALPHTYPGAESGQPALGSAAISGWSGRFTSGARGSRRRSPPLTTPRSAPLPCAAPRPRPARASLLPPLPGTVSLSAPAAAAAAFPDPTLLVAGAGAAAGGVGWEGRKRGQREGPGGVGRSLASPPSFLYTLR